MEFYLAGANWASRILGVGFSVVSLFLGYTRERLHNGMLGVNRKPRFQLGDTVSWNVPHRDAWADNALIAKQITIFRLRARLVVARRDSVPGSSPSTGDHAFVVDVALDQATTTIVRFDEAGRVMAAESSAPISALQDAHGGAIRTAISYCGDAGRCLRLNKDCARLQDAES